MVKDSIEQLATLIGQMGAVADWFETRSKAPISTSEQREAESLAKQIRKQQKWIGIQMVLSQELEISNG